MTTTQIPGDLAENELKKLAEHRISEWLLYYDGDDPNHEAANDVFELRHAAALTLLAKTYANCGWHDLESDLVALSGEESMWRSWARLTLYHYPVVKDLRCGLAGEKRQSLRKQLLAGTISEIERFMADIIPSWNDDCEASGYEQLQSARIQALEDLIARFDIEELKSIQTMLPWAIPRTPQEWMIVKTRLKDTILPLIRQAIGVEAEVEGIKEGDREVKTEYGDVEEQIEVAEPAIGAKEDVDARSKTRKFLDEGATYRIVMPEGEFTIPKNTGEEYLYWFAKNPRKEIRGLNLLTEVRGMGVQKSAVEYNRTADDTSPHHKGVHVDSATTTTTLDNLRARLKEIAVERARASEGGDHTRLADLTAETQTIEAQIESDTGLGGKIRNMPNEETKAKGAICKAIQRAYIAISKGGTEKSARKAFVAQFKEHLTRGYAYKYDVPVQQDWCVVKK